MAHPATPINRLEQIAKHFLKTQSIEKTHKKMRCGPGVVRRAIKTFKIRRANRFYPPSSRKRLIDIAKCYLKFKSTCIVARKMKTARRIVLRAIKAAGVTRFTRLEVTHHVRPTDLYLKTCNTCERTLAAKYNFYINPQTSDGLNPNCKQCQPNTAKGQPDFRPQRRNTRYCPGCGRIKSKEKFYRYLYGYGRTCKECENAKRLFNRFGLSPKEYKAMLRKQKGVCAICKKKETVRRRWLNSPKKLAVDHCHKTNKVRGLLCYRCNSGIGYLLHDLTRLKSAVKYLEKFIRKLKGKRLPQK